MYALVGNTRAALATLSAALRRQELAAAPVTVAYSGGPDSTGLLILLGRLPGAVRPVLHVIHVDHGLDGDASARALAAGRLAAGLGVAFEVRRVTPAGGGGLEAQARRARYAALGDAGRPVLTAHTLDDQAETVLLRLARGSGARGLSAMAERARIHGADLVRPLLGVRRSTLARLCAAEGLTPVEDPTNLDPARARSTLRHTLLPALERVAPGAAVAVVRAAALLREDDRVLSRSADRALARLRREEALDRAGLLRLPTAVRTRLLARWLEERGVDAISSRHLSQLQVVLRRGGLAPLPGRRGVEVGDELVRLLPRGPAQPDRIAQRVVGVEGPE